MQQQPSQNNVQALSAEDAEKLYFNSFPVVRPDEYKRQLLYLTYATIKENVRITTNKLAWYLDTHFSFVEADVQIAVNALSNSAMYGTVTKFVLPAAPNRKRAIQLSLKPTEGSTIINEWMDLVLKTNPEFASLVAPTIV